MSETDVFLGPSTGEGGTATVINAYNDTTNAYNNHYVIYHLSGVESLESGNPDMEGVASFINVEYVNGATDNIFGRITKAKL